MAQMLSLLPFCEFPEATTVEYAAHGLRPMLSAMLAPKRSQKRCRARDEAFDAPTP